ncbi:AI-2E family transporter [Gallibacterium melopsittaci]|uniref:AI-2E family transporter n=1 Tax=Gallibacterium melopsittaci TaxID=516063 RepID=A0ABV6HWD4_9PAST
MEQLPLTFRNFLLAISSVLILWLPVFELHLVLILFTALTAYAATEAFSRYLQKYSKHAIGLAVFIVITLFLLLILLFASWIENRADAFSASKLMSSVADILDELHAKLPDSIATHIPDGVSTLQAHLSQWLKSNAQELQTAGLYTLRGLGHFIVGTVLGVIAALQTLPLTTKQKALPALLQQHFQHLLRGFTNVFFAQVRISLINTFLAALYLLVILPAIGEPLPLAKTMVLITFFAGLIPVVGNLISNTFIVIMSLGNSIGIAITSLTFLVVIHKLEYFLNAEIIGHRINAKTWELLIAMVLMEAAFGIPGLVSAPVIYAQLKQSLVYRQWI